MLRDAIRLALGTLTAVPVAAPTQVDRSRAGMAMLLAPIAVLPLGLAAGVIAFGGMHLGLPPLAIALAVVGTVALGNRALHLDGLSDTVDALTASYDRDRALAVMKSGTAGPAGVVALIVVLGLQVVGLASALMLAHPARSAVLVAAAICGSRAALALCCARGVRPARPDGLGRAFSESVSPMAAAGLWVVVAGLVGLLSWWAGLPLWRGLLAVALGAVAVGVLVRRAIRRFGGVTGDVFGAAIEISLATMLVALS